MLSGVLLWLLPAAFLVHDAEETLFLPGWLRRNRNQLSQRFPRLFSRLFSAIENCSPRGFAAMAAEEFVLLIAVTLYTCFSGNYYPWIALFLAFGAHLVVHLVQWIVVGRYIPVVVTSLICLIYCGWGLHIIINSRLFTLRELLFCGAAGCAVAAVNLLLLHAVYAACVRTR